MHAVEIIVTFRNESVRLSATEEFYLSVLMQRIRFGANFFYPPFFVFKVVFALKKFVSVSANIISCHNYFELNSIRTVSPITV
jgi:hypothetical protein